MSLTQNTKIKPNRIKNPDTFVSGFLLYCNLRSWTENKATTVQRPYKIQKFNNACVAQLVVQLIRNAQVACSSRVSSYTRNPLRIDF